MSLTPEQLARPGTEHAHQVALMCACALAIHEHSELALLFAIPNGGDRSPIVAGRLKAEGVKPGVSDLFLPVAKGAYHGLFLELKVPIRKSTKNGGMSDKQVEFCNDVSLQGYACFCVWGWEHAFRVLTNYLNLGPYQQPNP